MPAVVCCYRTVEQPLALYDTKMYVSENQEAHYHLHPAQRRRKEEIEEEREKNIIIYTLLLSIIIIKKCNR